MLDNLMWIVSSLSILGAVLNAKLNIKGFYVWVIANLLWVAYDIYLGAYAQAALFCVYTGISIWGIKKWREKKIR